MIFKETKLKGSFIIEMEKIEDPARVFFQSLVQRRVPIKGAQFDYCSEQCRI